jgi:hypothetical protein
VCPILSWRLPAGREIAHENSLNSAANLQKPASQKRCPIQVHLHTFSHNVLTGKSFLKMHAFNQLQPKVYIFTHTEKFAHLHNSPGPHFRTIDRATGRVMMRTKGMKVRASLWLAVACLGIGFALGFAWSHQERVKVNGEEKLPVASIHAEEGSSGRRRSANLEGARTAEEQGIKTPPLVRLRAAIGANGRIDVLECLFRD